MNSLVNLTDKTSLPTEFNPEAMKQADAKADAIIEYAKRVKDWPMLEAAIDAKLEEQREFVRWWDETVGINKGGDRKSKNQNDSTVILISEDAEKLTGISVKQVSRWRKRLEKPDAYRAKLYGKAYAEVFGKAANYKANSDTEDEWYTPAEYIESARSAMGDIDLDPASNAEANETIQAVEYFTPQDNGLAQRWDGNIWLNPPYSRDLMPAFVQKLIDEYKAGHVQQAILVSHNNTDTAWFQNLARVAAAICFCKKRIKFYRGEDVAAPVNGQAFFYLGKEVERFAEAFSEHGVILIPLGATA